MRRANDRIEEDRRGGSASGVMRGGKGHEAHNPEWKFHQVGRCEDGDGFTLPDAVTACGGDVRYLSYICSDFLANPPGQPTDERVWTAYYECCSTQSDTGGACGASTGTGGTGAGTGGLALPPATGFSVPTSVFTLADLPAVDRDEGASGTGVERPTPLSGRVLAKGYPVDGSGSPGAERGLPSTVA